MGAEFLVPGGVVVALITGAVTFLIARRQSSGTVETSEAGQVFAALKSYQEEVSKDMGVLKTEMSKLAKDYREEARMRLDCEMRLSRLEAESNAAAIVRAAQDAADKIRAEAAVQREALRDAAEKARGVLGETASIDQIGQTVGRIETDQATVASNLVDAQAAVEGVAEDLAESHRRAGAVPAHKPAGTAADEASRQTDAEKVKDERDGQ